MRGKKAIKNIITSLLLQAITVICGFIVPRLIIGTYGSETNGLINSITQFLAFITLLDSGFGQVVKSLLYKPIAEKNKTEIENILKSAEKFFRFVALILIIYILALMIIIPAVTNTDFDIWYTISLIVILAISTFSEYFFGMIYKLYLQAEQKNYIVMYVQIGTTILNTIFVVILIQLGASIQIAKLSTALIFLLRPIIQVLYVKKKYKINVKQADSTYKIKQKWDGLAQHIASVIHGNTDTIVLTIFTNIKEVSVYSVYMLVINGMRNLTNSFINGIDATFGDMMARGEKQNLNNKFRIYELIYYTIITILYSCALVLIIPFVSIYTNDVTDVDYIRPIFAILIVVAEFIYAIRLPYSSITMAAGHFKQTRKGAIIEAVVNIVISLSLVWEFGIIGVAIGTLVAMLVRTVEFLLYASKNILQRDNKYVIKRGVLAALEMSMVYIIFSFINIQTITYLDWAIDALKVVSISATLVIIINVLFDIEETKHLINFVKNKIKKKENAK